MELLNCYLQNGGSALLLTSDGYGFSIGEGELDNDKAYLTGFLSRACLLPNSLGIDLFLSWVSGRGFTDKVDRLKLAEIVKQVIEEQTTSHESQ